MRFCFSCWHSCACCLSLLVYTKGYGCVPRQPCHCSCYLSALPSTSLGGTTDIRLDCSNPFEPSTAYWRRRWRQLTQSTDVCAERRLFSGGSFPGRLGARSGSETS